MSEEIVNDEPFPHRFTVMIHYFHNTLCTIYVFLGYLFWLEESWRVIFLCTYNLFSLFISFFCFAFFRFNFEGENYREEPKAIVFLSKLLILFQSCNLCFASKSTAFHITVWNNVNHQIDLQQMQ